jgi:hypothetical protein
MTTGVPSEIWTEYLHKSGTVALAAFSINASYTEDTRFESRTEHYPWSEVDTDASHCAVAVSFQIP